MLWSSLVLTSATKSLYQQTSNSMKKALIYNAEKAEVINEVTARHKKAYFEGKDLVVSDGYHTFDELYDHRIVLYMALCKKLNAQDEIDKSMKAFKEGFAFDPNGWKRKVWKSKTHSDGSVMEGWFVLGINKEKGEQITYHLPLQYWEGAYFAEELDKAPEYDGHSSNDVLARLIEL